MTLKQSLRLVAAAILVSVLGTSCGQVTSQTVETRVGKLDFELGVPTQETVARLYDEMDFQRACQLYLWGVPIVSSAHTRAWGQFTAGMRDCDVLMLEGYQSLSGVLTPNLVTPYVCPYVDLASTGPVVLDLPAGLIAGAADDFWQRPLTDFGVTGPDQGKGAKYLFVGPGQEVAETEGYVVVRSPTFGVNIFYRALDPDPTKAEAAKRGVQFYPWSQRANPPATRFLTPDPDKVTQMPTFPRGLEYWEWLAEVLYREPVEDRDRFFLAMLKPLGIEKGKPFQPDERQKKILTDAALVGEAMVKALAFNKRAEGALYRPDTHWQYLLTLDPEQDLEGYSQIDERAAYFYEAFFITKAMFSTTPGVGSAYLETFRDREGHALDGGKAYRLHVPPDPPAKQFWALTVYDVDTRGLIQNKEQIADRNSRQPDLVQNGDGSVDLYFGPTAPEGWEKNWIPTVPGKSWYVWLRFYGPLESYFDRTWPLPDIEEVR